MKLILAADVGSTFTKLTVIDTENNKIAATAKSFTTAQTNVLEGFNNALSEIYAMCGKVEFEAKLAASSAYGGLKMVSVGLVPSLTSKAARLTASSAGAKVMKSLSYELSSSEQREIYDINPDIVLLTGGIDGGNKDVLIENAKRLAAIECQFSVIVAGNKVVSSEAADIILKSGKTCVVTENVMPEFEKLNIYPAKEAIRALFIEKIIEAKGLDRIQGLMDERIVPTPLAVYDAVTLLSKGTPRMPGMGDLLVFDIGGATTDVYSCAEGMPNKANVIYRGIREPYSKRTVEADIGMRYSLPTLADAAGISNIAVKADLPDETVKEWIDKCIKNPDAVPGDNPESLKIDETLAACAVDICTSRHVGTVESVYTHYGEMFVQNGKDLSDTGIVVGTGGVIINSKNPAGILKHALYNPVEPEKLKPKNAQMYLDASYILSAMGLLAKKSPSSALTIMEECIRKIN